MTSKEDVVKKMDELLPSLNSEEQTILSNLPEEYEIDVPYYTQEKMFWSGCAIVQMLRDFHERIVPPQELIAHDARWTNWQEFDHETLSEDLVRYLARLNYMPNVYYPGHYVLPNFPTGVEGADFISGNAEMFAERDFEFFKAIVFSTKAPAFVRVHFTTQMYPMPEEMARVLDTCGHAMLITGWNKEGFIVNDPWNRDEWGGTRGGKCTLIPYEELTSIPSVNCCKDLVGSFQPLKVKFHPMKMAIHENRELDINVNVSISGLSGIFGGIYQLTDVTAELVVDERLELLSDELMTSTNTTLSGGEALDFNWKVKTGPSRTSYSLKAIVKGVLEIPAYPWEPHAKTESLTIQGEAMFRVDTKMKSWLDQYGRHPRFASSTRR
ncbi:hypothetical protein L4174_009750 [Photobacterium sp. CCB-ST2H9]|uniref:hypothetical protein n=1 Tax=Photobacterium sp. CCB-ST2H9 TaxID=2912855 RepID=UPI002005A906|nr:hypothetical protein [Photobacterium sp. CCB-ST2H9]UTM56132.1 hypothetical protein L4174_009750 [Photobacterium sp. CCB-ST2H9]